MITVAQKIKERPVILRPNDSMVRAVLEGRKTQFRETVKGVDRNCDGLVLRGDRWQMVWNKSQKPDGGFLEIVNVSCPYGKVGDRLWVKENFWIQMDSEWSEWDHKTYYSSVSLVESDWADVRYVATESDFPGHDGISTRYEKKSCICMPRWASRITLEIIGIRVERLQDISEQDAKAEGVESRRVYIGNPNRFQTSFRLPFVDLLNSINSKDLWDSNPWVWVVEFSRAV